MEWLWKIDGNLLLWIQEHLRWEKMNWFWKIITSLGNGGWFWILLCIVLLAAGKTRKCGWYGLLSMGTGFLITNICLKHLVARTRPYEVVSGLFPLIEKPTDFSFPSGHTCASFACAWILYHFLPRKYGVPALILAALIACSRMYLGVHYPTDILGGLVVACFSAWFVLTVGKYWENKKILKET